MNTPVIAKEFAIGGLDSVPRIGYGAMQLTGPRVIGLPDDPSGAIALLQRAVAEGVRFFDTANAYGPRTVNQLIGQALSPYSGDLIVGNKVGARRDGRGGWLTDNRPETIRTQVEDALLDLRADVSPLTYLRLWGDSQAPGTTPPDDIPLEEPLGVLAELQEQGVVRHIGLSGASPEMLEAAQRIAPIAVVQNRFNVFDRSGVEVLAACEAQGIGFVPFFPLASGALTDVGALTGPAERLGVTTSAVALAWLLRRSPVILPIPGTRSPTHLTDNLSALAVADELSDDEVEALTAVEDESFAALDRMPDRIAAEIARRRAAS